MHDIQYVRTFTKQIHLLRVIVFGAKGKKNSLIIWRLLQRENVNFSGMASIIITASVRVLRRSRRAIRILTIG